MSVDGERAAARLDLRAAARWSRPPVVAWVAASLLTWLVARASDVTYWSIAARERWDSAHYLSISRDGYEMFRCWDRPGYAEAGFRDVLCGNVAWFPGYPMVVRAFTATGLSYDAAAIVVSEQPPQRGEHAEQGQLGDHDRRRVVRQAGGSERPDDHRVSREPGDVPAEHV
ncbi:MAG: hypothetical protein EOO67_20880, partial [Microbacterium sp.]